MNVEISKNLLAGALSALGKLVCRTSRWMMVQTHS